MSARGDMLAQVPDDDPEILEGEIVDDDQPPRLSVVQTIQVVVRHEHARRLGRNIVYIGAGVAVVTRRLWDSRTTARYERYMRVAEGTGDHEKSLEWEDRLARFRKERHQRRMDLLAFPGRVLARLPLVIAGFVAVLALIGALLSVAYRNTREIAVPFETVAAVTRLVSIVLSVAWGPIVLALPWAAAAALWWTGRTHATGGGNGWVRTSTDPDMDVRIDETTITNALRGLRIPQIRDYLNQGIPLQYIVPCRTEGRGTYAELRLPVGVTADRIARRRGDLASGLYRLAKEVWPSTGSEAAILKVWIADKGALAEGAGPYPLLEGGFTDVYKGLPFGKTLRGDPIKIPVIGRNTLCGGIPEQGKSNAGRVVAAGYTLDLTTELRIFVPDTNFDFEPFKRRCSRYIMGAEDEYIEAILGELEELKEEIQARGQLLVDYEQQEVTRELASAGVGLHPMLFLLEEAHVAIQHKKYGKDISQLLCENVKLDRKRAIKILVSTQAPTKDSMPRDVTRNCSNGIAFAVGDHVANDALLGQGAYAGGHRATELIPGTDRGTALCKGFTGQRSEIAQVYRLDVGQDNDQVTPLVGRSLAEMARRGRPVPGSDREQRAIETRDLLEDLDEVMGAERIKLRDLVGMLRALAPVWLPYRKLTAKELGSRLADLGVKRINTSGIPYLDPADLRHCIADRSTEDLDEW